MNDHTGRPKLHEPLTLTQRIEIRHRLQEVAERALTLRNAMESTGALAVHSESLAIDLERLIGPLMTLQAAYGAGRVRKLNEQRRSGS